MAFDEAYNEPENVEVLVKSLDPGQPAQLHYAHAGDAGTHAGGQILVARHVDTCRVRSSGIFTHCAKIQSGPSAV